MFVGASGSLEIARQAQHLQFSLLHLLASHLEFRLKKRLHC